MRTIAEYLGIARTTMLLQQQREEEQRAIRELEIAAEIQQSLVPKSFPSNPRARVFGVSQAAFKVGGDYVDALSIGDGDILIAIADVMGKGMPAALLATILRTSLRARLDLADDPGLLLGEINRQISADLARLDSFITAQVAYFSPDSQELLFANAGHCPLLKYAAGSDKGEQFRGGGVPLGVLSGEHYTTHRVPVGPGDRFLLLTDGIYEAESPAGAAPRLGPHCHRGPRPLAWHAQCFLRSRTRLRTQLHRGRRGIRRPHPAHSRMLLNRPCSPRPYSSRTTTRTSSSWSSTALKRSIAGSRPRTPVRKRSQRQRACRSISSSST